MMRWSGTFTVAIGLLLSLPQPTRAQHEEEVPVFPYAAFLLTGYGSGNYVLRFDSEHLQHDFAVQFVPILLYQMGTNVLFEGEAEFDFEEDEVGVDLEYAQIDYLGWSHVVLSAGKFLLPFGLFSERFHPAWINKLPSFPLLYGEGQPEVRPLLPVLSDIGALVRIAAPISERWAFDAALYTTQGPRIEVDSIEVDGIEDFEEAIPAFTFGNNFEDNNDNKLLGARAGFVHAPAFEAYLSGFYSHYDPAGELTLAGLDFAPEIRHKRFELRGEGVLVWQQVFFEDEDEGEDEETVTFPGYYLQASIRLGNYEPVIRWSHLLEAELEDITVKEDAEQLALGLDYWLYASIPVKLAYEINFGFNDRFIVQWAYGF